MNLIGNKFFDIVQLDEELLKTQKDRIFNLMKELESAHEKDYRQQKIKDMEKHIKDKSAIIYVALDSGKIIGYICIPVRAVCLQLFQILSLHTEEWCTDVF